MIDVMGRRRPVLTTAPEQILAVAKSEMGAPSRACSCTLYRLATHKEKRQLGNNAGAGYRVRRPRARYIWNLTHYRHQVVRKSRWFYKEHDIQPVTRRFNDADGNILQLGAVLTRRENISATVPIKTTVVNNAKLLSKTSHSTRVSEPMLAWLVAAV